MAIAPVPPPENVTVSAGTAAGLTDPFAFRRKVVLTGVQPDPRRTRTGSTYSASESCPSGSADTVVVAVVSLPDHYRLSRRARLPLGCGRRSRLGRAGGTVSADHGQGRRLRRLRAARTRPSEAPLPGTEERPGRTP